MGMYKKVIPRCPEFTIVTIHVFLDLYNRYSWKLKPSIISVQNRDQAKQLASDLAEEIDQDWGVDKRAKKSTINDVIEPADDITSDEVISPATNDVIADDFLPSNDDVIQQEVPYFLVGDEDGDDSVERNREEEEEEEEENEDMIAQEEEAIAEEEEKAAEEAKETAETALALSSLYDRGIYIF